MILRTGEVLQEVAVRLRWNDAQVEPEALIREHRRLRRAVRHDLDDPREPREVRRQRLRVGRGGDDVEVPERLFAPPCAAGFRHLDRRRVSAQDRDDGEERSQAVSEQAPIRRLLLLLGERFEHALLRLRPEAREGSQLFCLGGALQLLDRGDAELVPDASGSLRAEPRQAHEHDDLARHDVLALRQGVHLPVLHDLDDLFLDRLADPVQILCPPHERELSDASRRLADARRRAPVGKDAKRRFAFELEQVREQLELLGHVVVPRERLRHATDHTERPDPFSPGYRFVKNVRNPRERRVGSRTIGPCERSGASDSSRPQRGSRSASPRSA